MRAVDAVARAERVEIVLGTGMPRPRQRHRVDHPAEAHRIAAAGCQLPIQEAEIEMRIVRHQGCITDEGDQRVADFVEIGLVRQEQR